MEIIDERPAWGKDFRWGYAVGNLEFFFAIPYDKVLEASSAAKIIVGVLVWSCWNFMTMIVDLKDDGGKVNISKRGN